MRKYNKRQEGELSRLVGDKIPKRMIFFDTETTVPLKSNDIREFKLILGVAIFIELDDNLEIKQKVVHNFRSALEFVDIIKYHNRYKQLLYLFAHNIGFDIRVLDLPSLFDGLGYTSEPPIINQMAFIWRVKSDTGNYLFLDTANLGVRSVQSLGHDMGYEKEKIDFDRANLDELSHYCFVDTDILSKFVNEYLKFIRVNNLGTFKSTLASQSLTAFRTSFMETAPYIHNDIRAISLERKAYHGGRVECFALGQQAKQNWFYLDVNSMYPFAMKGNDLPVKYLGYSENVRLKEFAIRLKNYYIIADVMIDTDEPVYPLLKKDKLLFPIGRFRTQLSHPELVYAWEHGHIKQVFSSAQYKMGSLFDKYVDFFYDLKKSSKEQGNNLWTLIAKLYLNAHYGKYGQTEPHREELGETQFKGVYREPSYLFEENLHVQYISWYGKLYKEYRSGETSFSCPYIASAVTAKARMLLWMYIKHAGKENVKYCDTDSLIVNARGYRRLLQYVSVDRLGSLKLETQSKYFKLFGNKDYIFDTTIRHKGLPSKAEEITKEKWEYLEFEGFIRWMNRGAKGAPKGEFRIKQRKSFYNKGIVDDNKNVIPFKFDEQCSYSLVVLD